MIVAETARLVVRWMTPDDAPFMRELLNDEGWRRFISDKGPRSLEDARDYIVSKVMASYAAHGFGLNLVCSRDSGESLGICGLIKRESLEDVDVGFAFLPRHAGQGYAFEATAAVMEHGRRAFGLTRIVAVTVPENARSIRLLERVGMTFQRTLDEDEGGDTLALYGVDFTTSPAPGGGPGA